MNPELWPKRSASVPAAAEYAAVLLAGGMGWQWGEMCHGADTTVCVDDDVATAQAALSDPTRIGYDEVRRTLGL